MELPNDLIKEFEQLEKNTGKMLNEMTQEGAKVVQEALTSNLPSQLNVSGVEVGISKPYQTKDGARGTKVYVKGYHTNRYGQVTPIPLIANMLEVGKRSTSSYPHKSFLRKSFKKSAIEKAMMEVQKRYINE